MNEKMDVNQIIQYPVLGNPQLVGGKVYRISAKAIVGKTYIINCPVCANSFTVIPNKEKANFEKCPQCKAVFGFNAKMKGNNKFPNEKVVSNEEDEPNNDDVKTEPSITPKNVLKHMGKLEWGSFFMKKSACLQIGLNIIGRKDGEQPSDISFNDAYMSRRSVSINVEKDTNWSGYKFKLTVMKAANPVLVGSNQLFVGNSIYLNYGDIIKMGNTVITFKEL